MTPKLLTCDGLFLLTLCLPYSVATSQDPLQHLTPGDNHACVLAGQEAEFSYFPIDSQETNWQVGWRLIANSRTVQHGNLRAAQATSSEGPCYTIKIPIPPVRDGVVLSGQLQLQWHAEQRKQDDVRPLYLFSQNPFAARQNFLLDAQIWLFDTQETTTRLLDEYQIPHRRLINLGAVDRLEKGIVLVGEGLSFATEQKLLESLWKASQRGVSVVCLAPSGGTLPLTLGWQNSKTSPNRFTLERSDFVRRFDRRFDLVSPITHLALAVHRNDVALGVVEAQDGWSWSEIHFPPINPDTHPGRIIISGLGLVTQWKTSPIPRHLFLRLLEELTSSQTALEKKNAFTQQ